MDKKEFLKEEEHLEKCAAIIDMHIENYAAKVTALKSETKELYDNYRSDNPELHNELVTSLDWQNMLERSLKKNLLAKDKPFFGRIDYTEQETDLPFSLYIGKHGVMKDTATPLIVDWRAPVSSIYYDSDIGESSYPAPLGERIDVQLGLKRTFEIDRGKLMDFYDTDVISNDEFLTKYLAKNKEVVLGEIISTIQKEQNDIIRDTPWHSVIVQGVAGSGKTTVAMHRISYILYNYKDKFRQDEFYIIGSNKMLLNYITGVLPNLDVYNINQMTMSEFFEELLGKDFNIKKKKFQLRDHFSCNTGQEEVSLWNKYKGSLAFSYALEKYLQKEEDKLLLKDDIYYKGTMIYSKEDMEQFLHSFPHMPIQEKIDNLNKRLETKIKNQCLKRSLDREEIQKELKEYKNYYGKRTMKIDLQVLYMDFLNGTEYGDALLEEFLSGKLDIYDLAMIALIKKKFYQSPDFSFVKHIVIDEAQDFGVSLFYALRILFPECTYTIMGDTSQNIYYDTGMNDWKDLREQVFSVQKDKFYLLAKSYRNTIEISDYASSVLNHCSFEAYKIQPVIRHGQPVIVERSLTTEGLALFAANCIKKAQNAGFDTLAVICRTTEEAAQAETLLCPHCPIKPLPEDPSEMTFTNGVMVLPIHMTKGLEFDAVLLWNPNITAYPATDAAAKLLYVAITRALHELYVVYTGELSPLLL